MASALGDVPWLQWDGACSGHFGGYAPHSLQAEEAAGAGNRPPYLYPHRHHSPGQRIDTHDKLHSRQCSELRMLMHGAALPGCVILSFAWHWSPFKSSTCKEWKMRGHKHDFNRSIMIWQYACHISSNAGQASQRHTSVRSMMLF